MAESEAQGEDYEAEHVHSVYEEIASHFSSTRYKPWPIVEQFLKELPDGSVGADVGCGNGKYLAVNQNIFVVGSDRSKNLIKFAQQHQPHSALVADNLSLPHPAEIFDFAISIAVIHHLSTSPRRIEAVKAILDLLRRPSARGASDGGKALIYVWALEQKESRRGWDAGHEQDVMVPWVMKSGTGKGKKGKKGGGKEEESRGNDEREDQEEGTKQPESKTFLRYYHLYRRGELEQDVEQAGGKVVNSGYEKDNWWAIVVPSEKNLEHERPR